MHVAENYSNISEQRCVVHNTNAMDICNSNALRNTQRFEAKYIEMYYRKAKGRNIIHQQIVSYDVADSSSIIW